MTHHSTLSPRRRKRTRKSEYAKPFNSNIIAWILFAALALFVVAVRCFW